MNLRRDETLDRLLGARASTTSLLVVLTGLGVTCDVVMIAQLLTARAGNPAPFLHGPGITWLGAIWFSAHALLFLGYVLVRLMQWLVHLVAPYVEVRPHRRSGPLGHHR